MKKLLGLSYIYSAASIFIGPALVFFSSSRHPSGWDCSDPSWGQDGTAFIPLEAREVIYDKNAQFMVMGAYIMLAIGIGIASYIIYVAVVNKQFKSVILPLFLMTLMFLGYFAIIAIGSLPWC